MTYQIHGQNTFYLKILNRSAIYIIFTYKFSRMIFSFKYHLIMRAEGETPLVIVLLNIEMKILEPLVL